MMLVAFIDALNRPHGLWLLLWLLPLLWRLRHRDKPQVRATGTHDIWREISETSQLCTAQQAPRIPPWAWFWLFGLTAGTLAVVDPLRATPATADLHVLYVDRSPSMYLAISRGASTTRYGRAVELALEGLEAEGVSEGAREWRSEGQVPVRASSPPSSWAEAPIVPQGELPPSCFERPMVSVVTDKARDGSCGQFASGGAPTPGPVGERELLVLTWDGDRVRAGTKRLTPRAVALDPGASLELQQLFALWAAERGHDLVKALPGTWVFDSQAHSELPNTQDPAQWALHWAQAFDAALSPRAGHCSLEERQGAGDPVARLGKGQRPVELPDPIKVGAWWSLASLLAAVGAFWPRRESSLPGRENPASLGA